MKKSLAVLAGLTLASAGFAPMATADVPAPYKILIASCIQTVERTGQPTEFHGSTEGTNNNIPIQVAIPDKVVAGSKATLGVTFPSIEGKRAEKSAFQAQKALGMGADGQPYVSLKNFSANLAAEGASVQLNAPEKLDLGQAVLSETMNKMVYELATREPINVDVTPAAPGQTTVTIDSLSFELHGAADSEGETTKVSTVNCTFSPEGTNMIVPSGGAVTEGNVIATFPVVAAEAEPTTPPTEAEPTTPPTEAEPTTPPAEAEPTTPPAEDQTPGGEDGTTPADNETPGGEDATPSEGEKPEEPKPAPAPAPWSFEAISQTVVNAINNLINAVMPLLSRVLSIFNFIPGVNF